MDVPSARIKRFSCFTKKIHTTFIHTTNFKYDFYCCDNHHDQKLIEVKNFFGLHILNTPGHNALSETKAGTGMKELKQTQ